MVEKIEMDDISEDNSELNKPGKSPPPSETVETCKTVNSVRTVHSTEAVSVEEGDSSFSDIAIASSSGDDGKRLTSELSSSEGEKDSGPPAKKVILFNTPALAMLKASKSHVSPGDDSNPKPQAGRNSDVVPKPEGSSSTTSQYSMCIKALTSALKSEPKKKVFCANTNCNMKTDTVFEAPSYAKSFFGMSGPSTKEICLGCFKKAEIYHEKSKSLVANKENLFDLTFEIQTASSDSVVDLDSPVGSPSAPDETTSEKKPNGESEMYAVDVQAITDTITERLKKFNLESQVKQCLQTVTDEVQELVDDFNEMDTKMDDLRNTIDSMTKKYNENIAASTKAVEIGSVQITGRGAITAKKADNLDNIPGLTRIGAKALTKALAELKELGETPEAPEFQKPPAAAPPVGPTTALNNNRRIGKLIFVKPKEGQDVYAMHKHSLFYWLPAKILKMSQSNSQNRPTIYTVQFQQKVKPRNKSSDDSDCYLKDLTGKQLAFKKPSSITLPVGTRIIAKFKDLLSTDVEVDGMLYAGIIAEVPRDVNKFRYLVFFDDGYAQYVLPHEVLPVVESSPDVCLDVHRNSQDFVKDYLSKFPDRHMIRAEVGATFTVELNGQWLFARIVDLDGSLMKVQYLKKTDGVEFEWIYRGSTRLGPLFSRLKSLQAKPTLTVARRHTYSSRRTNFSFEVNRIEEDQQKVAKKHTGYDGSRGQGKQQVIRTKDGETINTQAESEGNMIKIQIPNDCPSPRPYRSHKCSVSCAYSYEEEKFRKVSPLAIPFYLGWAREVAGANRDKIYYHTPCGIRCGSYEDIHSYITYTDARIPIDYFSMEPNIDCLNEFEPLRRIEFLKDISYGKEWTPVTCVNSLDHELPLYMEYITTRIPGPDVHLSDDPGFLTCCDCEDDCMDKEKCACWQMTLSGVSFKIAEKEGTKLEGYEHRRLKQHVLSGIYECNRKCKCRSTCFNRVVQNKVKWPIQLFKTVAKGWGVRALHDMPQGSFINVYTGQLLTDEGANASGIQVGDEYLAELDFIECNEQIKEDYESDCTDIESEEPGTKSNARLERSSSSNNTEQKIQLVAKKSTVQKAMKSTGGLKRKLDDGYSSSSSTTSQTLSTVSRPVARKSGSKNGARHHDLDAIKPNSPASSASSGIGSPAPSLTKRSSKDDSDEDDDEVGVRAYSSFSASSSAKNQKNAPRLPLREYFGKDESVYIMDAKSMGNFGRYLNHSCDPNVFVQNLFVDTHDPRFPWVAFFTKKDVKAGTELTWDYNYDIGSVPGKTLYCYCLQPGCRGRLL